MACSPVPGGFDKTKVDWIILIFYKMVLAFFVFLVIVVLMDERKREPGGKEGKKMKGIQKEVVRGKGLMVGRSHLRSC